MNTIHEPARDLPIAAEVDLCVVGGSCTGVFAAVAAARLGARVAIVEDMGFFGGVATAGLVNVWHSLHDTTGQAKIIGGLTDEVIKRLQGRCAVTFWEPAERWWGAFILHTEFLKIVLDELITEAGVRPFLHTHFCAPILRDGQFDAIAIEDKTGRRAITARCFIDASGDADLAQRCGLPCRTPRPIQPPTTCAMFRGIEQITQRHPGFSLKEEIFNPKYPQALPAGTFWSSRVPGAPDEIMAAGTRVFNADCSDADQLTRAEIEGRRQVAAMCQILQEHFLLPQVNPLVTLATKIGIRESRHVCCLHQLTEPSVLRGERFADAIANGTYPVDIHHADKPGLTWRHLDGREVYCAPGGVWEERHWLEPGAIPATFYQVPYRCLVPQDSRNLLIAGRMLDADEGAFGAVRVMVMCNQLGQAAGTAAYLAIRSQCGVAEINTDELRKLLAQQGAIIAT